MLNGRNRQCETWIRAELRCDAPKPHKQSGWLGFVSSDLSLTSLRMLRRPFPKSIPSSGGCQTSFPDAFKLGTREFQK